jgi:hypothetical protein
MMLLKMVAQSLGRHPRRTVLILFAVMISVFTMEIDRRDAPWHQQ